MVIYAAHMYLCDKDTCIYVVANKKRPYRKRPALSNEQGFMVFSFVLTLCILVLGSLVSISAMAAKQTALDFELKQRQTEDMVRLDCIYILTRIFLVQKTLAPLDGMNCADAGFESRADVGGGSQSAGQLSGSQKQITKILVLEEQYLGGNLYVAALKVGSLNINLKIKGDSVELIRI